MLWGILVSIAFADEQEANSHVGLFELSEVEWMTVDRTPIEETLFLVDREATGKQTLDRGMWTLNAWALTNIATGIPLGLTAEDPRQAAFYGMNAGWNTINLGLATMALVKDSPVDTEKWSRIFWVNAGLDVGYVATGLFMAHRGRETGNPQLEGWGNSIAMQGGFLVGFDAVMGWRMGMFAG